MAASGERRASASLLTCRVGTQLCGLPLGPVLETMRPLPVERLPDLPAFVRGVSLIRGAPTPVVDLRALLDLDAAAPPGRYVTIASSGRSEAKAVALAVDAVLDVIPVEAASLGDLPELLQLARRELVRALMSVGTELLLVLEHSRLLPDERWPPLMETGG